MPSEHDDFPDTEIDFDPTWNVLDAEHDELDLDQIMRCLNAAG